MRVFEPGNCDFLTVGLYSQMKNPTGLHTNLSLRPVSNGAYWIEYMLVIWGLGAVETAVETWGRSAFGVPSSVYRINIKNLVKTTQCSLKSMPAFS